MLGFRYQVADFGYADVVLFRLGINSDQEDAVAELGIIDHAEAPTLAAPGGAIRQAYFVFYLADARHKLAGTFIAFQARNQLSHVICN